MRSNALYSKLFLSGRYFTIALRKRQDTDIINNNKFVSKYIVPAVREKWVADPILVDSEDRTYLFYEAVIGDKGHIEVAEVFEDCTLGEPTVVLQDDCHYSYPFVFSYKNEWYMIPESSAATEVRLYRAKAFPDKWEMCSVLLYEKSVDTTVFEHNGQLYLLTFFLVEGSERVVPHAYEMKLNQGSVELTEIEWGVFDELKVRGAGPVFKVEDRIYRPAQISQEQRYGDGLAFYQIEIDGSYNESLDGELSASNLTTPKYYVDGLHTYCSSKKFEAIDIRCGVIDYLKPVHKVLDSLKYKLEDKL